MFKQSLSISQSLAQSAAAAHIFCFENDSKVNYADVYEIVLNDSEVALEQHEFYLSSDYENHESEGLVESLTCLADNVKGTLERYGKLIKVGAKIHAMSGNLLGDVSEWDLDEFARLGAAIESGITMDGFTYAYNHSEGHWESEDGLVKTANWRNNFLPDGYSESQTAGTDSIVSDKCETRELCHSLTIGAGVVVTDPKHPQSTHLHSFSGSVLSFTATEVEVGDLDHNVFWIRYDEIESIDDN